MPHCFRITIFALACLLVGSASADDFPQPYDTETDLSAPRLSPDEAAAAFKMPEGFRVSVFAAEPSVANPIACAWDTRGRLWIAENFTYAERPKKFELELRDRVLIFTDKDDDGRADEPKVFLNNAQRLTSIEVGLGGVWLMCPPQLLFVPDRNGDDIPDGPAEAVLEGFTVPPENFHNFANGLRWGPDGWLYGRCGASAPGMIRRADAPTAYEVPLRGGIWRFHPKTKQFEALCHGTTNPWGHDWDQHGECFFINTVNGHLWHMIPGAHYRRPHTINANPLVYEPMETHADHWHWDTGKDWVDSRKATGEHDVRGGGHAHVGMMIYQGENWPEPYRGRLMTLNQHGRRMNVDRLEREGSGYVGRHEPDIFRAGDLWFRGVEVTYGPDGGVYVLDWSDTGECHEATGVHRTSGRIYKVTYGEPRAVTPRVDLTKVPLVKLVQLVQSGDEWHSRAARRELARRALEHDVSSAVRAFGESLTSETEVLPLLRSLWAWHQLRDPTAKPDYRVLMKLLKHPDEHVRAWAVRIWVDHLPLDTALGAVRIPPSGIDGPLLNLAVDDGSGLVRLSLASALQRSDAEGRLMLASQLLSRAEDADDHNLPALIWYGLIPVAEQRPEALIPLAISGKMAKVRQWIARRCGELAGRRPELLDQLFAQSLTASADVRTDIVLGAAVGLEGQRQVAAPASWPAFLASFSTPSTIPEELRTLGVVFGDGRAMDEVRTLIFNDKADLQQRRNALQTYIEAEPADLKEVCTKLLKVRFLNTTALQGLAKFDDPALGRELAKGYRSFHHSERAAVIDTLASRPSFAAALLEQMVAGQIARGDLNAVQARQIRSFGDATLTQKLVEAWGEFRDSPQDKQVLIDRLKSELSEPAQADVRHGRAVFQKHCANCHKLFGSGGEIGPDLTGANRQNLDYLLGNIVDPSAVVTKDFLMTVFAMTDGRVINGIVTSENETTVTVQTAQNKQVLLKADIDERRQSKQSLMPDGLLQTLSPDEIANLFAYLRSETQVALP